MKRNLTLFGVLILLLGITWWFQERGAEIEKATTLERELIFNPEAEGGLQKLSFGSVDIYIDGEKYYVGQQRISANNVRVAEIFATLQGLAVIRSLSEEEATALDQQLAFPSEQTLRIDFTTPKGVTTFVIGAPIKTSEARFYGKISDKLIIIEDRRPLMEAYQQESESDLRLRRLQTLFSTLKEDFFYDTHLFREQFTIAYAAFDNRFARPYEVDLLKRTTNPAPPRAIAYDLGEFDTWRETLELMEAATLHTAYNEKSLDNFRAQLKLKDAQGKTVELSLFGKYGPLTGDFVISSNSDYLFELGENHAGVFFQNVQDFWQISALAREESMQLKLSDSKASYDLTLKADRVFDVSVKNASVDPRRDRLAVLYNLLTGRAAYISELAEAKALGLESKIIVEASGKTLEFAGSVQEWVIVDRANSVAYHYRKRDFPDLPSELADYFGK